MTNEFHAEVVKYNNSLRKWVVSEYQKLNDNTAQIFMLDTNYLNIVSMAIDEKNRLVYKSGRVEEYNLFLNYYWIEYDFVNGKARKKITFYCKDIDCKTGNVHVIPGVMQEWERIDFCEYDYSNIPSLKYENKQLYMMNVPNKEEYKAFVEEGWIPIHCGKNTLKEMIDNNRVMPNLSNLQKEFRDVVSNVRKTINGKLKDANISTDARGGRGPKYTIIIWTYVKVEGKTYMIAPYDISYIPKFGIITNYGLLSICECSDKERNDDKISLGYEIAPAIESKQSNVYYVEEPSKLLAAQDEFSNTVEYIKQTIKL